MSLTSRRYTAALLALLIALSCAAPSGAASYRTLEFGSRGSEVLKLQQALLSLGFDPSGTDGKYGRGTESAVMLYQTANGLTPDGKAGSLTLTKLYAALNSSGTVAEVVSGGSAYNPSTIKYGDSGARVLELQTALMKLGYNTSGVDGRFGSGTKRAVISFQSASGLTADGLAGTRTQELLYSLAGSASSGGTTSAGSDAAGSNATNSSGNAAGGSASDGSHTRTLRKGMTGEDVKAVQAKLKELGYYSSSVDGVYGAGSITAVKTFQQLNKLTADGLVGTRTYDRLFSSSAVAAGSTANGSTDTSGAGGSSSADSSSASSGSSAYTSLSYGSKGSAVTSLQMALKALNYNVGVDGDYGALTQSAVAAFQKRNGLTADGVAGVQTQEKLFGGSALAADPNANADMIISDDTGRADGPSTSSVKLLHWFNDVKPSVRTGQTFTVFDPATNLQWTLRFYSLGRHADSEPLTLTDTQIMYKAFGYTNTWTPKAVYVKLPSGVWTLASMHNVPHLTGSISDNGFNGHLCVHFLRDMDECQKNDPNYGVTNQNLIRKKWKQMTGETVE